MKDSEQYARVLLDRVAEKQNYSQREVDTVRKMHETTASIDDEILDLFVTNKINVHTLSRFQQKFLSKEMLMDKMTRGLLELYIHGRISLELLKQELLNYDKEAATRLFSSYEFKELERSNGAEIHRDDNKRFLRYVWFILDERNFISNNEEKAYIRLDESDGGIRFTDKKNIAQIGSLLVDLLGRSKADETYCALENFLIQSGLYTKEAVYWVEFYVNSEEKLYMNVIHGKKISHTGEYDKPIVLVERDDASMISLIQKIGHQDIPGRIESSFQGVSYSSYDSNAAGDA